MLAIASKDVTVMSIKPPKYEENCVLFDVIARDDLQISLSGGIEVCSNIVLVFPLLTLSRCRLGFDEENYGINSNLNPRTSMFLSYRTEQIS